ncbi:RNA polymerase sigma factor [Pedobacter faecalis]|uniref:RNA polymerase sigma factor n=1 Tax=Pedobacter faecalis TaxID=3041495 RepID=UPI00254B1478|nr:sigma-70 family RNA polymerase sigma factor [Pedobacter sp. ELA7]
MALRPLHNEAELLKEVVKGNESAFAELFYGYHQQLGVYVQMLTGSKEMTQEIVQDVFVKVWMNREALGTVDKFTSYLFILTRNYTLNCIRKSSREQAQISSYGIEALKDELEHPEDKSLLDDPEYISLVERAVAQLPPQQQKVFRLRQQGLKNPEIAREMDISTESVKKYQQWALKAVAEFVKAHAALSVLLFIK